MIRQDDFQIILKKKTLGHNIH